MEQCRADDRDPAREAAGDTDRDQLFSDIFAERYLIKRPLLQALEPDVAGAPVLLIDELDRADEAFEAYLLEILSDFQVTIPEFGTVKAPQPPIVIITSNRTREIHDALKRRCLYHWVDYPTPSASSRSSSRACPASPQNCRSRSCASCRRCATRISTSRRASPRPSTGHRADRTRRPLADPQVVGDTLGALLKYQDDIARMQGDTLQKVLKEATSEN